MKTILVIYTDVKITDEKELRSRARYAFNTINAVEVGDMLKSNDYKTAMQVVEVLFETFTHYNMVTGDLSYKVTSTKSREIKELRIETAVAGVILATRLS